MEIQDFKRWHWIVISLVVGALLAYARTMVAPDEQSAGRGISAKEFADNVVRVKTGNGYAWIKDVTVYPPTSIIESGSNQPKQLHFVSCSLLTPATNGKYKYKPVHFNAEVPFVLGRNKAPSETYNVRDFLDGAKQNNPEIQYRFAWWAQSKTQFAIWMGGAVLLIGGIWPSLIGLMVGAGLGGAKKEKDAYDLDRFGKTPESARKATPGVKAGMSAQDQDQLREMGDRLEQELAGAGLKMTTPGEAASAAGSAAVGIRKLEGGPVEQVAIANDSGEPKEYGGEYYPVVKPHHEPKEKQ